jgi:zinc protease
MKNRNLVLTGILLLLLVIAASAQKQTPPEGAKPKDFTLPKATTFTLGNAMKVTMVHYGSVPKVSISAVIRTGAIDEKTDEIWLASLVGKMMKQGTETRTAEQVNAAAASMGGSIDVGVGDDQTTVGGDILSSFGNEYVALIADVIRHPKFPESELGRLKNDQARELSMQLANPQQTTMARFEEIVYPGHPYGRGFPSDTLLLSRTIGQVKKFYASNFGAARTHLYVVGRFDEKPLHAAIQKAFASWEKGPAQTTNIPKPVTKNQVVLLDRPGAPQSTLEIGLPVVDPGQPDYLPMQVTNNLLGGSFASRITSNIREQKGYTYSPFSMISSRYRTAYWAEFADVTTNVTGASIHEIESEIKRLGSEPPPQDELNGIANYMAGTFVLRNASRGGIVGQLGFLDFHGLPQSYLTNYVKNVHAVTPETVSAMAKKYLRPEDLLIVITGDKKEVSGQVSGYGTIAP